MKEVVISNSRLNSYGGRVLTEGIDIEQYKRNPILLWMHNRAWRGTEDEVLALGTVENLRIEDDKLIGTPVFDGTDAFCKKIKEKWESGTYKAVSAGLDIIELSEDPEHLLPGQKRATVTKSKLVEVSIVDIGANDDALALYQNGKLLKLSNNENCDIPEIKLTKNKTQMKTIALKLGLAENATESDILTKISELQTEAGKSLDLSKKLDLHREQAITSVVESAISENRITADKKEHFMGLGKTAGIEALSQTLSMITPAVKPTDFVGGSNSSTPSTYSKLSEVPAEEVERIRKDDTDQYAKLFKAEYGFAPEIK